MRSSICRVRMLIPGRAYFYWVDSRSKSRDSLNYIDLLGYYRYYSYYVGMTLLCEVDGLESGIE